jgi:hypothetical protein
MFKYYSVEFRASKAYGLSSLLRILTLEVSFLFLFLIIFKSYLID